MEYQHFASIHKKNIRFYKQIHSYGTHVMLVCSLIVKNISFCNVLSMSCIKNVNITQVSLMFSLLWNTRLLFVVFKTFIFPMEYSLFCVRNANKHNKTNGFQCFLHLFGNVHSISTRYQYTVSVHSTSTQYQYTCLLYTSPSPRDS